MLPLSPASGLAAFFLIIVKLRPSTTFTKGWRTVMKNEECFMRLLGIGAQTHVFWRSPPVRESDCSRADKLFEDIWDNLKLLKYVISDHERNEMRIFGQGDRRWRGGDEGCLMGHHLDCILMRPSSDINLKAQAISASGLYNYRAENEVVIRCDRQCQRSKN